MYFDTMLLTMTHEFDAMDKGKGKAQRQGQRRFWSEGRIGKASRPNRVAKAKRLFVRSCGLDTDKRIARLPKVFLQVRQQFMLQLLHPRLSQLHTCTLPYNCPSTHDHWDHMPEGHATPVATSQTLADSRSGFDFRD